LFSGNFEPPGSAAVTTFVTEMEKEYDPRWQAVKAAERRVQMAEKTATQAPAGTLSKFTILNNKPNVTCLKFVPNFQWQPNPKVRNAQFVRATWV